MSRLLNTEEYTLFKSIVSSTQEGIRVSMIELLEQYYGKQNLISTQEYIVAIGTIPVGIVAHMDTVHSTPVKELFYDREYNVMWSPEGLGADDRAGVYSMIEFLRRGFKPTLILTTDEEKGALGASALIGDLRAAPCELNFLIELDRRGVDDCVFYSCANENFEDYIEDFGFKFNWGSFSDISYLCPAWGIAGVNLSIGYEDEHSYAERLYVDAMFKTIDRVCNIFKTMDVAADKFEYVQEGSPLASNRGAYGYDFGYDYGGYDDLFKKYGYSGEESVEREVVCWDCLGVFKLDEVDHLGTLGDAVYCKDCYNKRYTECIDCRSPFEDFLKVHLKCENCRN